MGAFIRGNEYFVVTVNNLKALEAVSQYVHNTLKTTYFIEIENSYIYTIYYICIPVRQDSEEKIEKALEKWISKRNIKLFTDSIDGVDELPIATRAHIRAEVLEKFIEFANTDPTVEPDDGEIRPMNYEEMAKHVLAEMEKDEVIGS